MGRWKVGGRSGGRTCTTGSLWLVLLKVGTDWGKIRKEIVGGRFRTVGAWSGIRI